MSTNAAAAATIDAVEARWRAENRRQRAAERFRAFRGCLSWIVLLILIPGVAWYFYGDQVLPGEWTFKPVYARILAFLNLDGQKVDEPVPDTDPSTARQRAMMRSLIKELEKVCWMPVPIQDKLGYVEKLKAYSNHTVFDGIITADRNYKMARETMDRMMAKNDKLDLRRGAEGVAHGRKYLAQYSSRELSSQEVRINDALVNCAKARLKSLERAHLAVKGASSKWSDPKSRADAAGMLSQLEVLYDKLLEKIKEEQPGDVAENLSTRLTNH